MNIHFDICNICFCRAGVRFVPTFDFNGRHSNAVEKWHQYYVDKWVHIYKGKAE